jgi:hypothetical protein
MALLRRIAFKVETVHKVHLLCPIRFMAPIKNAVSALWVGHRELIVPLKQAIRTQLNTEAGGPQWTVESRPS